MSFDCFPAVYLALVIRMPPPQKITAIPLKPSPRIIFMEPAFFSPNRERQARVNFKTIKLRIMFLRTKLGLFKPTLWKFFLAIRQIFAAKYSQFKHFFGGEIGFEIKIEVFTNWLHTVINIIFLHFILDHNFSFHKKSDCAVN